MRFWRRSRQKVMHTMNGEDFGLPEDLRDFVERRLGLATADQKQRWLDVRHEIDEIDKILRCAPGAKASDLRWRYPRLMSKLGIALAMCGG